MKTLQEAQEHVEANRRDGVSCPCCGLFVKMYTRKLNSGMAATLCWLVNHSSDFVHVNTVAPRFVLRRGGEWTLLRYWGLIEEKPADPTADERTSGLWRPTEKGRQFARKLAEVPSHALTFNRGCIGLVGDPVGIEACLGDRFSYRELMQS